MNEEQAKERIEELRDYYTHLATYIGVNIFLFIINMINLGESGTFWFIYPLFGWGIGLLIHTFDVFWSGQDWEQRKMMELTGLSQTQDELQRLSERTENLITILSSVNWEKIDPELMGTKRDLEQARDTIIDLQDNRDRDSQEQVTRQIEKLEEFVTSSKFGYYQMAAQDKK